MSCLLYNTQNHHLVSHFQVPLVDVGGFIPTYVGHEKHITTRSKNVDKKHKIIRSY